VLYETFIHLPFGLYSTFVIEERHGFNKQTLLLYFTDKLKGLALGVVLGYPALSALLYIIKWGGPYFYIYAWTFMFVFTIFMMTIYPNVIAPLFNKFDPLPEGELKAAIEALAAKIKFPLTKLYVVDGSKRSGHRYAIALSHDLML
jgi:STE24 endopeptidase